MAVKVRVTVWIILFVGMVVNIFHTELLNVTILSMVKNRNDNDDAPSTINNTDNDKSICGYYREKSFNIANESSVTTNDNRLDWNKSEQNLVLGSGYWFVWIGNFAAGLLMYRFGAKIVIIVSTIMCSFLSFLTPPLAFVSPMIVAWISGIKGFLTTLSFPVGTIMLIGKWSPVEERGRFMSVFISEPLGGSLGYLIFSSVSERIGWTYSFHIAGFCSLLWCISWWYFVYDTPEKHPRIKETERKYIQLSIVDDVSNRKIPIPWKSILTSVPFYIIVINHFGFLWLATVVNVYGPTYFYDLFGFSTEKSGLIMGVSYFLRAVFCYFGGAITDCIVGRKLLSITDVRKLWTVVGGIIPGLSFLLLVFCSCNSNLSIIGVVTNISLSSFFTVGTSTSIIDLSPNFCNILQAICSSVSFSSGLVIALFVQYISEIYDIYTQWQIIFAASAIVQIVPAIVFLLFGTSEVQPWNNPAPCADITDKPVRNIYKPVPTNIDYNSIVKL